MITFDDIVRVNHEVNNTSTYVSDITQYGKLEYVENILISLQGDCEDYGIGKAIKLLALGAKVEDLRMAKCYVEEYKIQAPSGIWRPATPEERYHGVLLVDYEGVTYCLDNRKPYPVPWNETGYEFDWVQIPGTAMYAKPELT